MPNDDAQVDAMISLLEEYGITKVGMIYTTDAYAGSLAQTFKQQWVDGKGYELSPTWENSPNFSIGDGVNNADSAINTMRTLGTIIFALRSKKKCFK